jgi:SAM-dependent methyltransferase
VKLCLSCGTRFNQNHWQCDRCHAEPATIDQIIAFAPELAMNDESYNPELFEQLAQLEKNHFWFHARNKLIFWVFRKYFPSSNNFLEIGCGTGFVLAGLKEVFPKLSIAGSEINAEGLKCTARRVSSAFLFQMDARRIPYEAEFDVIGAFDVIEHIYEDAAVLQQMHRAVRPGGGIIVTVPQHRFLWSKQDEFSCHFRRYTRGELISKVCCAGFTVTTVTSFVSLLLPLMIVSRFFQKNKMPTELGSEFRLGKRVNQLLGVIMGLERRIIQAGGRFPAGGSLLLIAKKQKKKNDEYPI